MAATKNAFGQRGLRDLFLNGNVELGFGLQHIQTGFELRDQGPYPMTTNKLLCKQYIFENVSTDILKIFYFV